MKPRLFVECVFWLSVAGVIYTYFLYPVLLFVCYALAQLRSDLRYLVARGDRRARSLAQDEFPGVSFLIPAYNEEKHLPAKIANLREVDYPPEKLQVIFVSDGSTDGTNEILRNSASSNPNVEVVLLPTRSGKPIALNHAVGHARHEILVLSDAATLFSPDAVRKLARHFSDRSVGAVCGSLRFQASPESQQTEGVYWKYESMLRLMEARLGATLTASGAIYAIRRSAFVELAPDTVLDDFIIPMNARKMGYRVLYDPEAVGMDVAPGTVAGEFARRVRLAVGSFRAVGDLARIPLSSSTRLAFFSHKVLRWTVPLFFIALLISNALLIAQPFYRVIFIFQLAFYLWAGLGYLLRERAHRFRFALLGYFLLAMNLAFLVGFVRSLVGREGAIWQRIE
jgi:cellulose synthase/poly-beta-1,6-N-acetylglucosamine synthase-like glycosyltransferase